MVLLKLQFLWLPAALGALDIPTRLIAPGVNMPVVSIGTGGVETASAANITSNWLQLGGRGVDTAQIYRDQAVIAQTLAKQGVDRKDVFITTKIMGCALVDHNVQFDLKQLGTDYIDLLLIHFPKFGDCGVAWKILEGYFKRGVLKSIGVSNFKKADLQHILKTSTVVPHVNQIELNVFNHDDDTISFCEANNITVEAFSPIGRNSSWIRSNSVVNTIASRHNVSTYQVAMKWILQHGHILTFQSASEKHQQEDADLFSFTLNTSDMATLDALQNSSTAILV